MAKRRYSINKINFIRQALSGYVGNDAIVSELLQNADDAKATHVSFHLQPNALEIHNNSIFTEEDFTNILDIASGGKRRDTEKIGTWGTGFLSVFHVTDCPELESNGIHLIFDPHLDELDERSSLVKHETVFRLPWRRTQTELAKNLEAKIWADEDIHNLQEKMLQTLYSLILFLRHVRTIEVFSEEIGKQPQLILRIHMREDPISQLTFGIRQSRTIEYKDTHSSRTDEWLYYKNSVPAEYMPTDVTAKDRRIELAFPRKSTEWLKKNLPGTLYNFLPTPILTGLPFQVNGSFFPDNNRRHILLDKGTQPEKARWNHAVITALGRLLADAVVDLREQIKEPARFYELLPLKKPSADYLHPIREQFVYEAKDRAIVFHSQSKWGTPREVYIGNPGSTLPQLAANDLPVVREGTPQAFRNFLTDELAVSRLDWKLIAGLLINKGLKPGTKLLQAPTIINTRDKLEKLYTELQLHRNEVAASELFHQLPLCLDQTETLRRFRNDSVRRGDAVTRKLLAATKVRFLDNTLQEKYALLLNDLVTEVRGADVVEALAAETWPVRPLTLDIIKGQFVANFDDLFTLLKFIQRDLNHINADQLAKLPIVRDADDRLFCPADGEVYLHPPISILNRLGCTFLHRRFAEDADIVAVYRKANDIPLNSSNVIKQLNKLPELLETKRVEEKIDFLAKLYAYFFEKRQSLTAQDKLWLQAKPLCLTSNGNLRSATDGLTLSSNHRDNSPALTHLDKLQLDTVIDSHLLTDDSERFLSEVLGIQPLSPESLISGVIVNHYHDTRLNHDARRDLLQYISIQIQQMSGQTQIQLIARLADKRLIECQDGTYRCGKELYFPSSELEELFPTGYPIPHADYGISPDKGVGATGQSQWYWLFYKLGVNEHAQAEHVIKAIREIVDYNLPVDIYIDRLRPLYQYLRGALGGSIKVNDPNIRQLATIPWLPASNDRKRWFHPSEIYPSRLRELIGVQAPLLAFQDPTEQLNEVLNMHVNPPTELVVNHLRTLAKQKQNVSARLYAFLEQHHTDAPVSELKREAIIWDPKEQKFWKPDQVFFSNLYHKFGGRRGYFKAPGGEFQGFLERLGVRSSFDMQDSIKLIEEIADEYGDSMPLNDEDRLLLSIHFDELSHSDLMSELKRLVKRPIVPDAKSYLHRPERIAINNWPDALQQFTEGDIPTVHEHFVTHTVLTKLDVKPLTSIIQRTAENAQFVEDTQQLELRLRQLSKAFRRIALKEQQNHFSLGFSYPDQGTQLQQVRIRPCKRLEVSYSLDNQRGWKVKGRRRDEQALYDLGMNVLYIQQSSKYSMSSIEIAHELIRALFPGMPTNHLSPIVEGILDRAKESIYAVERYLDSHQCPRLPNEEAPLYNQTSDKSSELTEWPEQENPESEFEVTSQRTLSSTVTTQRTSPRQESLFDTTTPSVMPESLPDQVDEQEAVMKFPSEAPVARPTIPQIPRVERVVETPVESALKSNGVHKNSPGLNSTETSDKVICTPQAQPLSQPTIPTLKKAVTSLPDRSPATDRLPEIPPFTGRLRPVVPQSSNDYVRLRRQYSISTQNVLSESESSAVLTSADYSETDSAWNDVAHVRDKISQTLWDGNERTVEVVRFTLTYQNRTEGFLPLHGQARLMLRERPLELRCQVDVKEAEFPLYVDYERGILYNQTQLKELFEAYNIPAGGIVYLQHVHVKTVRLFWKQSTNKLTKVQLYDLQENGSVQIVEIPEVNYQCEIDEYVVRAEKRLEEPLALFAKALEWGGLFEIMCDVFGAAGKELSYKEIFDGVKDKRFFADGSIRFQLHQRPCFVKLDEDHWRFEPSRGLSQPGMEHTNWTPYSQLAPSTQLPTVRPSKSVAESGDYSTTVTISAQPVLDSPYAQVLKNTQNEWHDLSLLLDANNASEQRLQEFLKLLERLAKRLAQDISAVSTLKLEKDDLLDQLWQKVKYSPSAQQVQTDLRNFLLSQTEENTKQILQQIKVLLANTDQNVRESVFLSLLAEVAEKVTEQDKIEQARSWYQLLQEQQAGNFSKQLQQLEQLDAIRQGIALIDSVEGRQNCWSLCHKYWQQYPGNAQLRRTILSRMQRTLKHFRTRFSKKLDANEILEFSRQYRKFLDVLDSMEDIWRKSELATEVASLCQIVFGKLVTLSNRSEQVQQNWQEAWYLSIRMQPEQQKALPADKQLLIAQSVAHKFFKDEQEIAGVAILEYIKYVVQVTDRHVDDKIWCDFYQTLSGYYEKRGLFDFAAKYLSAARQKATGAQKHQYNERQITLDQKKKKQATISREIWQNQCEVLLDEESFCQYVDVALFKQMCVKLFKEN